jgi:hypothetical protein
MAAVIVVRRVPPPIIGVIGQVPAASFDTFEETLDWLEATGTPVERVDASEATEALARLPGARELLEREGAACLPIILVNDLVVSHARMPSRAELAHLVALSAPRFTGAVIQHMAAVAAAAALGDEEQLRAEVARARALGVPDSDIALASDTGRGERTAHHAPSTA